MFRKSKTESEYSKLRQKHIDEFLKLNPSARPSADKSMFTVPVNTIYGTLGINVIIPASFPERPPMLQSTVRVSHPWVDRDMYLVNHPKLNTNGWTPHSNLGVIVGEIVQEWAKNPPMPQEVANANATGAIVNSSSPVVSLNPPSPLPFSSSSSSPSPSAYSNQNGISHSSSSNQISQQQLQPSSNSFSSSMGDHSRSNSSGAVMMSSSASPTSALTSPSSSSSSSSNPSISLSIPSDFPLLDTLSIAQLEELNNDPLALDDFLIEKIDSVSSTIQIMEELQKSIKVSCQQNISKRYEYDTLKRSVEDIKRSLQSSTSELEMYQQRQLSILNKYSIGSICGLLEKEIEKGEEMSEKLRESYESMDSGQREKAKSGGDKVNEENFQRQNKFVDTFIKIRQNVHEKTAKKERIVQQYQRSGGAY